MFVKDQNIINKKSAKCIDLIANNCMMLNRALKLYSNKATEKI